MDLVRRCEGKSLPSSIANRMAATLGQEVDAPILHTDSASGETAGKLNALALSLGAHEFLGHDGYAPEAEPGAELLAAM